MHVCKFKLRKTKFMGHEIKIKACKSCHGTEKDYRLEVTKEGNTKVYLLPSGSVLPHIHQNRVEYKNLRNAVQGKKVVQ